jgi:hypothetical protein
MILVGAVRPFDTGVSDLDWIRVQLSDGSGFN